jgi:competence protein ComEC
MRKGGKDLFVILLLIAGAALFYYFSKREPEPSPAPVPGPVEGRLVVRFLDIGQGDAQLLQLPGGEVILIDSGDRGKPTVDLLRQYGVGSIDLLIATHPHADHIGEVRDILRAFTVKEVWDSGYTENATKTYTDMLAEVRDRNVKFATPKRGETRQFGDVQLEVLNPGRTLPDETTNNSSIVVRLTYGSKRFLFTGDAEVEAWRQMIASEGDRLRADLLKAAHHGSSNGTTKNIIDAVQPSFITISCAAGNDYHHPHPRVVDLLERNRDRGVFRTDLHGTITAVSDGREIQISTEKQVAQDLLYATGDEVAGSSARRGNGSMDSGGRGTKGKK